MSLLLLLALPLLGLCGLASGSGSPAPPLLESPLLRVLHESLFANHGVTSTHSALLAQAQFQHALRTNASQALPFLGCGPATVEPVPGTHDMAPGMEQRAQDLLGSELVHVARDLHAHNEVCLLLHAAPEDVVALLNSDKFGQDTWKFEVVPFLLKVNQKVLELLDNDKETFPPPPPPPSTPMSPLTPGMTQASSASTTRRGEHLELIVQFFPGVKFSQGAWQNLMETWPTRSKTSEIFQEHLSVFGVSFDSVGLVDELVKPAPSTWEVLRQKYVENEETIHSFGHCSLPTSTSVEFHPSTTDGSATVAKFVDLSGWEGDSTSSSIFCLMKLLEVLSSQEEVLSISIEHRPTLLNYDVRGLLQSGSATSTPFSDARLIGEGQVVGVADSGLDDKSCFFWDNSNYYSSPYTTRNSGGSTLEAMRRKVVQYTSYADDYDNAAGHGTHVTGTIVGDSTSSDFSRANGVAPGAKVAFYDVQRGGQAYLTMPALATSLFPTLYKSGARVFSNSWGSTGSDTYTDKCYDVDYYTYNNPDVLVLFAAGNSGAYGSGSAFNPCSSKNALCVGSIDSRNDGDDGVLSHSRVSYFSSQGPTGDGRIKPDIVGPGFKVVSALSGGLSGGDKFCGVYETFGTSMATPGVAGTALILRDYFLNVWSSVCLSSYSQCKSFVPTGYLLKAILIHSGQAVSSYSESAFDSKTDFAAHSLGSPPDSVQGYGSVNLNSIIPLSKQQREKHDLYISDMFGMGGRQSATLKVTVSSNKMPLKITLLWYDRPSTVGNTNNLLIVNLDLTVTSPSGDVHYGNGVDSDSTNPQEQVYISSPQKGTYTVSVVNVGSYSVYCALVVTCQGSVKNELALTQNSSPDLATALTSPVSDVSIDVDTVETGASVVATAGAVVANLVPQFSSFDLVKSFTVHHTLSANERVLLKTFELPDDSLELFSIELSLDAHYCSGSEAFIFAVMVLAPNGEMVQVGGYNEYASLDRLWQRMSPVQWTASSVPENGGSYWRTTRYVVDLEMAQRGKYEVYVELMHDSWPSTTYNGNVKLNFVDAATALSRSKSTEGFFSSLGAVGAGILIFVLAGAVVFTASLVMRRRRDRNSVRGNTLHVRSEGGVVAMRKTKHKSRKASQPAEVVQGSDEGTPWSHITALLDDYNNSSGATSGDVENPLQQQGGDKASTEDVDAKVRHKRYKSARKK